MPNRALWKNLETPKQNLFLERLSANYRRPAPTGSPDRLDATVVRHRNQAFAQRLLQTHGIILIEHDYPKQGDTAGTSRFSCRTPPATTVAINYDGTHSINIASQNQVVPVTAGSEYTSPSTNVAVATVASTDIVGRRRVIYPVATPMAPVSGYPA